MSHKEGYGMKKSEKMGMQKQKTNGKKEFWDSSSIRNPKPFSSKMKGGK